MPFESVLVEAYKGTRRKHNMKFRQIGHTTSQHGQSFFPKTISAWNGLVLLKLRHNTLEGSCGILIQKQKLYMYYCNTDKMS